MTATTTMRIAAVALAVLLLASLSSLVIIHQLHAAPPSLATSKPAAAAPLPATRPSQPLVATLKSGMTIEILGVVNDPLAEQGWWQPDGSPLPHAPIDKAQAMKDRTIKNVLDAAARNSLVRQIALRIHQKPELGNDRSDVQCSALGNSNGAFQPGNAAAPELGLLLVALPARSEDFTVRCRIATGPWKTAVSAPAATGGTAQDVDASAGFTAATESDGVAQTTFRYRGQPFARDMRQRIVAIDTDGHVVLAEILSERGEGTQDGVVQTSECQVKLPLAKIKEFQFQVRHFDEWIEFHHVAIDPEHPTQPRVLTSDDAGGNAR